MSEQYEEGLFPAPIAESDIDPQRPEGPLLNLSGSRLSI